MNEINVMGDTNKSKTRKIEYEIDEKNKSKKRKIEDEIRKKCTIYERIFYYDPKEDLYELFLFYYTIKPLLINAIDQKTYNARKRNIKRYIFQDVIDNLKSMLYPKNGIDMLFEFDLSRLIKKKNTLFKIKHEDMQYKLLHKKIMADYLDYMSIVDLLSNNLNYKNNYEPTHAK